MFYDAKLQKITLSMIFFSKKFAGTKKMPYLCNRKSEMTRNLLQ